MRTLAIANMIGRGGAEFKREARAFCTIWGAPLLELDDDSWGSRSHRWPWNRRAATRYYLKHYGSNRGRVQCVAIFGHGSRNKLIATGHSKRHLNHLADALALVLTEVGATVLLYSCLTGRGRKGFADLLWQALLDRGITATVIAAQTAGHLSWNPFKEYSGGPSGGTSIIGRSHPFWKQWVHRLATDQTFRLSFWALGRQQLIDELDPQLVDG